MLKALTLEEEQMHCKSFTLIAGLVMATISGSGVALAGPEILSDTIGYETLSADQMSNIVGTQALGATASVTGAATAAGLLSSNVTIDGSADTTFSIGSSTSTGSLTVTSSSL